MIAAALVVALVVALGACTAAPTGPGGGSATSATVSGTASGTASRAVPGVQVRALGDGEDPGAVDVPELQVVTEDSWARPTLHAKWPLVPGAKRLNQALDATVRGRIASFRKDAGAELGDAVPDLTTTWSVTADHDGVVGIRLTSTEFGGASTSDDSRTTYGTRDGSTVWRGADLVRGDGHERLVTDVLASARAAGVVRAPEGGTAEPGDTPSAEALLADVSFTREGGLRLVVASGELAASDAGRLMVTIDRARSDELLTEAGRRVRDAAVASRPDTGPAAAPTTSAPAGPPASPEVPAPSEPPTPTPSTEPTTVPAPPATTPATTRSPKAGARVDCAVARCIALTFDDGPGRHTPAILDALAARGARATFFTMGPAVQAQPGVVRRMRDLGMDVGNHTWTHKQLNRIPAEQARGELTRTSAAIREVTGADPVAARPPYGAFSASTPHAGLPFVLWDVDTEDWKNRDAAATTRRALAGAHRGAIVLMHDIHPSTARAVPGIVDQLKARGYSLVTVSELLGDLDAGRSYYSAQRSRG